MILDSGHYRSALCFCEPDEVDQEVQVNEEGFPIGRFDQLFSVQERVKLLQMSAETAYYDEEEDEYEEEEYEEGEEDTEHVWQPAADADDDDDPYDDAYEEDDFDDDYE